MDDTQLEQAIMDYVGRADYEPSKARMIARGLGLGQAEARRVREAIRRLVARGQLRYGAKRRVERADAPRRRPGRIVGVFRRTEAGYGFVRPSGPVTGEGAVEEIYIPARKTADAATGDLVAVELSRRRGTHPPGPRGRIVEVIERQTHQFVGTYGESAGAAYVEVDGTVFAHPIYVGDASAHRVRPGDKVVIEMLRFPSPFREGEAVITEVLGPPGRPGVDTLTILREFGLPEKFPEDVLAEARAEAERFDAEQFPDRRDATAETVVTIDPPDAKDFDDAISLVHEDDHWRLGVHIADVSHFVRPKTALDREARQRATSVYLPDRVIPMLPELISNGLASLQPGKRRLTKSVYIEFTPEGVPVAVDVCRSVIKSNKRLTYEQVDQFLADPGPWRRKLGAKVCQLLSRMHELAMILRRRRLSQGALELFMPEVKVELDRHGRVVGATVVEDTESHQIIEEFMLAANEAVARWLASRDVPFLRRVHPAPSPQKLKALSEFLHELGLATDGVQDRFELQRVLRQAAGRPEQHAVHYAVLRSLPRAIYSPEPAGHYALGSDCYCHFTSPIRRYPDLTVHRVIDDLLDGRRPAAHFDQLMVLGQHCSEQEQRAEMAERELIRLKLLSYLSTRIGQEMDAVITGVESYGMFVQGLELPAEGLVHIASLGDDFYRFDRTTHSLTGQRSGKTFRLGDLVRVAVYRVDLERRQLDFRLVGGRPSGKMPQAIRHPETLATGRQTGPSATGRRKARSKK